MLGAFPDESSKSIRGGAGEARLAAPRTPDEVVGDVLFHGVNSVYVFRSSTLLYLDASNSGNSLDGVVINHVPQV